MAFKIYLVKSNVSGKIKTAYATKDLAKQNKGIIEHIKELLVEEEADQ